MLTKAALNSVLMAAGDLMKTANTEIRMGKYELFHKEIVRHCTNQRCKNSKAAHGAYFRYSINLRGEPLSCNMIETKENK